MLISESERGPQGWERRPRPSAQVAPGVVPRTAGGSSPPPTLPQTTRGEAKKGAGNVCGALDGRAADSSAAAKKGSMVRRSLALKALPITCQKHKRTHAHHKRTQTHRYKHTQTHNTTDTHTHTQTVRTLKPAHVTAISIRLSAGPAGTDRRIWQLPASREWQLPESRGARAQAALPPAGADAACAAPGRARPAAAALPQRHMPRRRAQWDAAGAPGDRQIPFPQIIRSSDRQIMASGSSGGSTSSSPGTRVK